MRCSRCGFENMPGQKRCFKCNSVLLTEDTPVTIEPPRMAGWKKPFRVFFRQVRRLNKGQTLDSYPGRLPHWLKNFSRSVLPGLLLSVIPGLAHVVQKKFRQVWYYVLAWLVFLILAIVFYGTVRGLVCYSLAIVLHAWIVIHASLRQYISDLQQRIIAIALVSLCIYGLYWLVALSIRDHVAGGYINFPVPYQNIESGDYLLVRLYPPGLRLYARGDLVLIQQYYRDHDFIVQVIGLPGETVEVIEGRYVINGIPLKNDIYPVPPFLQSWPFSSIIQENKYFISADFHLYRGMLPSKVDIGN
ncbi:MAG: hypothetical protein JW860_01330 [Sedimentisphaerales bacterium]|nr:hypothetical protein [Sedimentisphaerales bacterium]